MTDRAATSSPSPSDAELLAAFSRDRSETAFADVVRRHAGLVLSVCRSVLGNTPDAEDAAQAVFLTLAQKTSSRHVQAHLVGWLHKVAWYISARALAARNIRRRHEKEATRMKQEFAASIGDTIPLESLHAALATLPEKFRVPLLLHHLEGRTQEETAALLGCTTSAVAMRLNRGRQFLRSRLQKQGLRVEPAALAAPLATQIVPAAFVALAAKSATAAITHQLVTTTVISNSTLALSKGAIHMLYWTKIKLVAAAVVLIVLTGGALGAYVGLANAATHSTPTADSQPATTTATITGIAKALPAYNPSHMNPAVANATVTVTENGADTVYEVYGWAGIICAKNDGKTVQVTGTVRKTSIGKLTITARSIDVKIIVVQ